MKLKITAGTTSRIIRVFIQDSTSTTGAGLTGLVFNSAGLTAYYSRVGEATATAITLVTATAGTYASAGFKELDATNMPGVYELHLPNAVIAAGSTAVHLMLKGASNMVQLPIEIELDVLAYQSVAGGANTATPLDAAGTRTALGLASANLDTQLADLPTVAEFEARTLPSADYLIVGDMPANFAGLGINASGHIERVVLVDTTTTNTDMRGTDGANTATPLDAAGTRSAVGLASANLDTQLSTIDSLADGIATEVGKIPRSASAIAAGGSATRTKVSANGTTLVETIS